jgi:glycosyltransferase involved in cell wall biosynthesis
MKKVIFFASSYKVGLTSQLTEQAIVLSKRFRENFLFVSGEKEQFPDLLEKLKNNDVNHVTITGLDEHKHFFRLLEEFSKCVAQFEPSVVHCRTNWQLLISVVSKIRFKKDYSIIYTVHGYRHNYRYRSELARCVIGLGLLAFADKVITPSAFLKNKFSFLNNRANVLFIGVGDELFMQYKPPFFDGTQRIVFPGEFRHGKNQDILIRALRKYIDKTGNRSVELHLPGEGAKLRECRAMASRLGLGEIVCFPGFLNREEMIELYLKCQFAIVPSNMETFGHCITEPFVLGRVVISRHVGVADDIIIHGENGFLYNTEDELVELLVRILPDKEKCARVAKKAFDGRDVFRLSNLTEKYLALINSSYLP